MKEEFDSPYPHMELETLDNLLNLLPAVAAVQLVFVLTAWLVALSQEDNSIVDILWGPGILLASLSGYLLSGSDSLVALQLVLLTGVWAARLAGQIALKNRGTKEDRRYAAWRKQWGDAAWWKSLVIVFGFQGLLMLVIALTSLAVSVSPYEVHPGAVELAGMGVFLIGLLCETIGDYQKYEFRRLPRNRGKLLTTGLWRYTRHPNYFGEALVWVGIGVVAYSTAGLWALIAPGVVFTLVRLVSGVPKAEEHYRGRADFRRYAKRTNVFMPWFPRGN